MNQSAMNPHMEKLMPEPQTFLGMIVEFKADGVRREDGKTAAEVEAELAALLEDDNGAE